MNEQHIDSRILLTYLAIKFNGDFDSILTALTNKETDFEYEEALNAYNSLKCHVMTILDYDYPKRLKQIFKPPFVLFYYGDISILDLPSLAVVGTRKCNQYGKKCIEDIIGPIIKGKVVVSGLAKGIDTIGHKVALANGGRTIAVLGSGIDYCYPMENLALYEEIKKNHLLISEYPFDTQPNKDHFPKRNRIIAGLADAMYIPQINSHNSGTMISINLMLTMGKDVYVAPHPLGSDVINNNLLNEGASIVVSSDQLNNDLGWSDNCKKS